MQHYDDIDYDQFLHPQPASEIAKPAADNPPQHKILLVPPLSSLATPTTPPPKTNSGPLSTKPSSIASPPTPNSATLSSPPSAKASQTTEAGEILGLTTKIWQNKPGDLVQTNHFPSQVRSGSPTP